MEKEHLFLSLFIPQSKGECIARFRQILALTQTDISKDLGLNRSSISKMENGDMAVSEQVWKHTLQLTYTTFENKLRVDLSFKEFRNMLERWLEKDKEPSVDRREAEWTLSKSSLEQEMSI